MYGTNRDDAVQLLESIKKNGRVGDEIVATIPVPSFIYVNEFSYRLGSKANCEQDTIAQMQSMIKSSAGKKLTYRELIE